MAGRIEVHEVPGFNGWYSYYNISPLAFVTLFGRWRGVLADFGWRFGLYAEDGSYADFRRSAARENLIDREGDDLGPFASSFLGIQAKVGKNICFWQMSAGWPTVINMSVGLSRSRHTVSVNMRTISFFAASVGYTYGIH
jgi:hypothetical protein